MVSSEPRRVWTVAEAKAKLSEVLRLAESEGPQRIGTRKPFIVVPAAVMGRQGGAATGTWVDGCLRTCRGEPELGNPP